MLCLLPWHAWAVANSSQPLPHETISRFWAGAILYTLFVILFGAVVRITGSGAGCGQHWPTCHGEVAHLPQSVETLIELAHRVTSGLSLLVVFGLTILTRRRLARGHLATKAAFWSCVFMVTEALVGAGIVLLELVGQNDSKARAVIMAIHLVNTSLLTFSMIVTWWASAASERAGQQVFSGPRIRWMMAGAAAILVVSAAGAVTALGDTLFPVASGTSVTEVALAATDSSGHFLNQLRGFHPILASVGAAFLIYTASRWEELGLLRFVVIWVVILQVGLGVLNIALSAPAWMQVVHLATANVLWMAWICMWLQDGSRKGEME